METKDDQNQYEIAKHLYRELSSVFGKLAYNFSKEKDKTDKVLSAYQINFNDCLAIDVGSSLELHNFFKSTSIVWKYSPNMSSA